MSDEPEGVPDCETTQGGKFNIIQINVTSFSHDTYIWLVLKSKTTKCFMMTETKLRGQKFYKFVNKLSNHFHVYAKQARIKNSGPSGGVMILIRKDCTVLPFPEMQ
jgi:hypothetical protein